FKKTWLRANQTTGGAGRARAISIFARMVSSITAPSNAAIRGFRSNSTTSPTSNGGTTPRSYALPIARSVAFKKFQSSITGAIPRTKLHRWVLKFTLDPDLPGQFASIQGYRKVKPISHAEDMVTAIHVNHFTCDST